MKKNIILAVLLSAGLPAASALCAPAPGKETIRFITNYPPGKPDLLPYYVALKKGYFSEAGIGIAETRTPLRIPKDLRDNSEKIAASVDVLIVGRAPSYLAEIAKPGLFKGVASIYEDDKNSTWAIVARKADGLTGLGQLRSPRVLGLENHSGFTRPYLMRYILKKAGLDPLDYKLQDVSLKDFLGGKADALYTREPELTRALADPRISILVDKPLTTYVLNPLPMSFLLFTTEFIKEKPALAGKVLLVWEKAVDYIRENPAEADKIIAGVMEEKYKLKNAAPRKQYFWKRREIKPEVLQGQINLYSEIGILTRKFNIGDLLITDAVYADLLKQGAPAKP